MWTSYLQQCYGELQTTKDRKITFSVDGSQVDVDFPRREISVDVESVRESIQQSLERCEMALKPVGKLNL